MMNRKPRSDSFLKNLPAERQEQIAEWCDAPKTEECVGGLKHALAQLTADGIKVSRTALGDWFSWYRLQRDFAAADREARDIQELLAKIDPNLSTDQLERAGQIIFTQRAIASRDPEEFRAMEKLRLAKETAATKGRQEEVRLEQSERKLRLLERKEEKAQKTLADSKLSDSEKTARLRQIFKRTT